MVKKAEIRIERFGNGISSCWSNAETNEELSRQVALNGSEAKCIGEEIWADIVEFLEAKKTNKVVLKIEYDAADNQPV